MPSRSLLKEIQRLNCYATNFWNEKLTHWIPVKYSRLNHFFVFLLVPGGNDTHINSNSRCVGRELFFLLFFQRRIILLSLDCSLVLHSVSWKVTFKFKTIFAWILFEAMIEFIMLHSPISITAAGRLRLVYLLCYDIYSWSLQNNFLSGLLM